MTLTTDRHVLLFYKDYERDTFFPYDRYLKRVVRPIYGRLTKRPKISGFYVWCQLLVKALRRQGYEVAMNNYRLARNNPHYPVGLVGYPHLLESWPLKNPAVLGPGLFDHPSVAPDLMESGWNKFYLVTCDWMKAMFAPYYGEKCVVWYAGMDLEQWPDTRPNPKEIDFLIYDKIRWKRDEYVPGLLEPILQILDQRKLSYHIVRYGNYDHSHYRAMLGKARAMIFLCEHETQGMAYQEALTSNVPVLAWDNGYWLDPRRPEFEPEPVKATSVPYFSPECGERFPHIEQFEATFECFWEQIDSYEPRKYVERELSFEGSAKTFLKYYVQAASQR